MSSSSSAALHGFPSGRQAKNSAAERSISFRSNKGGMGGPGGVGGVKKLVIKPFKVQPKIPENFGMETWEKLKSALDSVYAKNASSISKEELYRAVEDLCVQKLAPKIYDLLAQELKVKIGQKVVLLVDQTSDMKSFLCKVDAVWSDHVEQLNTIRNIFLYLDRSYALQNTAVKLIWDLANDLFRQQLEQLPQVREKIIVGLLSALEQLRSGDSQDAEVIGRIAAMLMKLQLYTQFEYALLRDSERFFTNEGQHLITVYEPAQFLALVDRRLYEVVETTGRFLDVVTRKPLLEIVEQCLLKPHLQQLVEKGFKTLLNDDKLEELKRMYILFSRVQALPLLQEAWQGYARQHGEALVGASPDSESKKNFVESVLVLRAKLERALQASFFSHVGFKQALKSSFEYFVNINLNNSAALIAKFVDKKLRGEKGISEAEVEQKLDEVMMLFRYIQEKDIFEAFYKNHLSKRLLLGKSASYELEKIMLSKLKTECGSNYTSKLEGMFQDVELSRECQQAFQLYMEANGHSADSGSKVVTSPSAVAGTASPAAGGAAATAGEAVMQIQVLTTGYWPSPVPTTTLIIPSDLQVLMQRFNDFYVEKYQGRRLSWAHSLERCIVTARFPKGKKDLEVSLFQALVLRCFNSADRYTYTQLREMTGIEAGELKRTLQSLACGIIGTRVLTKDPKGKDVDETDAFLFNEQFTNRLFRIKINTIQLKETAEEVEKTNEEVFRDREYQVDAAIVRTMKARKRLPHTTLISELLTQLRFPAQTSDLKKRIESLIERDYLERDPNDSSVYNYLA